MIRRDRSSLRTALGCALLSAAAAVSGCRSDSSREGTQPPPLASQPAPAPAESIDERGDAESDCQRPTELAVLFIGNSYLNLHELPNRVGALGEACGMDLDVDKITMGGQNFDYHLRRPQTEKALNRGPFDYVVLQSHSLDSLRNRAGFSKSGAALAQSARTHGAEPVVFETWARRAGHNLYNYFKAAGGNPKAMQAAVTERIAEFADSNHMPIAMVGTAWERVHETHPEIDLFAKDGGHPNAAGAYLGACVVFATLTGRAPAPSDLAEEGVDAATAATLRAVATDVVAPPCTAP